MSIFAYGERADRTHENLMLQQFLEQLEDRWAASDDWIFVIANAYWNGSEIDVVCILPSAIVVADFKSHSGKLTGTENGPWQADGILVKGGSKANPFQQLRDNRFSVLNWLDARSLLPGRNLGHISASAMFSGRINDELALPSKVRSWLHPTDIATVSTLLEGLGSPELRIERKEAEEIVGRLGVHAIEWKSRHPKIRDIESDVFHPECPPALTPHQQDALQALRNFVSSNELTSFSVLGMTSTGKTRLLVSAVEEVEISGKRAVVLQPNLRLADQSPLECESVYSHLYRGKTNEEADPSAVAEQKKLKVIPLRECDDPMDCVYILDDAHLLGNSRFNTPDGKQYGSGHLLVDFFKFAEIGKSERKVIFFGDHYQIQRSTDDESALLGEFQTKRDLSHRSLELMQVIDTTGGSAKLFNAERLASAIRTRRFAGLELKTDDGFRISDKRSAAAEMLEQFRTDPLSTWYLAETHSKTNSLNQWVRERIHGKRVLNGVEPGDLLEIYVSPDAIDPLAPSMRTYVDGRQKVLHVGERAEYSQGLTWAKDNPVRFHSITCNVGGVNETKVMLFEEFLSAERPELEKETAVAESVWRSRLEKAWEEASNEENYGDAAKPPPSFTYARFGYASTVHHAQGMTKPVCYVNCELAAGSHSEGYFRWLYSALTVADRELVLFNFTEIHPFDSAVWNADAVAVAKDIAIGAGWSFEPDGVAAEKDTQRELPPGLAQSKDILRSTAIWLHVTRVLDVIGWKVAEADCFSYQEQYSLIGPDGAQCKLRIPYNGKNVVTAMHIDDESFWPLMADLAVGCLENSRISAEAEVVVRAVRSRADRAGWRLVSRTDTPYRLALTLVKNRNERVAIEVNFDKQGLVSSLRPRQASNAEIVDEIKRILL